MTSPRVAFETLGCKLNQYETDAIAAGFRDLGWTIVGPEDDPEAVVVNTCTVTNKADRKSRNTLGRHLRPGRDPVVVVTGCFAESARDSLEGRDGITFVVPNRQKNQIAHLVDAHFRGEVPSAVPLPDPFGFPVADKVFHTRASLKIQDGCDNFCSFCIIPSVRGRAVSRPRTEVLETARALIASGRKELVLTGVNLGRWTEGPLTFTDLVTDILALEGDFRVRVTSLEPDGLGDRFVDLLTHPKFSPHLHLCLQSGSPRILLAMRREYHLADFEALVQKLRARRPDLNLTTDLIVGFPGETDEDFRLSMVAVNNLGFSFVHAFPFSRREGTRADRMVDQVPDGTKARRIAALGPLVEGARQASMEQRLGGRGRVLVETSPENRAPGSLLFGYTEDYYPVRFRGEAPWNTFVEVRLDEVIKVGEELVFSATVVAPGT